MTFRVDWLQLPLGQVPDHTVADKIGCSHECVRLHRIRLGILPCRTPAKGTNVSEVLLDVVFDHVPHRGYRALGLLYQDVLDDYGMVGIRQVHRALRYLRETGRIVLLENRGYTRTR